MGFGAVAVVCLCAAIALHGCGDDSELTATDVASAAGIAWTGTTHGENCVFDYDRDGIEDLFLSTHYQGPWQLFMGTSDGEFVETNVGTFPARDRHGCATGDYNGDGRPDIYASIGGCAGTCRARKELWIQRADGTFVDRAVDFGIDDPDGRGSQPAVLNANGDNWPDVFTGQAEGVEYKSPNRLWLNIGGRRFVNPPGPPTDEMGNQCSTAGDIDDDGYDELVVCGGAIVENEFRVYDNTRGTWSIGNDEFGVPKYGRSDAELADLNGDERLDLLTVAPSVLEIRLNEGGRFPKVDYYLKMSAGRDLAVADADGDGDQDIYVVQGQTVPDLLLLSDGSGIRYTKFPDLPQVTTGAGDTVQAIPQWKGTERAAFLVNNGLDDVEGPRQLIELEGG